MKMLRLPEVIDATGLSRMTIYRMEARQEFPKRKRLGVHSVGWLEEDVLTWIAGRPEAHVPAGTATTARLARTHS